MQDLYMIYHWVSPEEVGMVGPRFLLIPQSGHPSSYFKCTQPSGNANVVKLLMLHSEAPFHSYATSRTIYEILITLSVEVRLQS